MDEKAKRSSQPSVTPKKQRAIQMLVHAQEASFGRKYCMHPQASATTCKGGFIRAHTIQRKGGLTRIARDGHVYNFVPDHAKALLTGIETEQRLIGIKKASTFTGFCGYHDTVTFEPLDNYPFQGDSLDTFLLSYRVLCKELYLKRAGIEYISRQRNLDLGMTTTAKINFLGDLDAYEAGIQQSVQALQGIKDDYDTALLSNDYTRAKYYVIQLNCTPDFLCSGPMYPEFDFQGRVLQSIEDAAVTGAPLEWLTFTLIPTDNGGAAVFSWLGESRAAENLVKSLHSLPDDQVPHALTRFTFQHFENIFASPSWWESLDDKTKNTLLQRQAGGLAPLFSPNGLTDDGLRAVSWMVTGCETNIELD